MVNNTALGRLHDINYSISAYHMDSAEAMFVADNSPIGLRSSDETQVRQIGCSTNGALIQEKVVDAYRAKSTSSSQQLDRNVGCVAPATSAQHCEFVSAALLDGSSQRSHIYVFRTAPLVSLII